MIEELEIILETTSKILQKHVNHSLRQNIVSENTDILNLWNDIEKNGLPKISVKEKFGGYEIPFFSILPLIKIVNNHGTPLPLSETILSNYILSESDINPPNGIVTFATDTKNLQIKKTSSENNLVIQMFEDSHGSLMTKLDIIDAGSYYDDSSTVRKEKRVFECAGRNCSIRGRPDFCSGSFLQRFNRCSDSEKYFP